MRLVYVALDANTISVSTCRSAWPSIVVMSEGVPDACLFKAAADLLMISGNPWPSALIAHSHIKITCQPSCLSFSILLVSLAWFASILVFQNSGRVCGSRKYLQLCPCQKHPCTKITVRYLGRTISGFPGRLATCSRNRYPAA